MHPLIKLGCFLSCGPWFLKGYTNSKSNWAKEKKKDPASLWDAKASGTSSVHTGRHTGMGWEEGEVRRGPSCVVVFVLLCCLYSRQVGCCWRMTGWAFDLTLSSCSHGLKKGSVIWNLIQFLILCPKATQLPK